MFATGWIKHWRRAVTHREGEFLLGWGGVAVVPQHGEVQGPFVRLEIREYPEGGSLQTSPVESIHVEMTLVEAMALRARLDAVIGQAQAGTTTTTHGSRPVDARRVAPDPCGNTLHPATMPGGRTCCEEAMLRRGLHPPRPGVEPWCEASADGLSVTCLAADCHAEFGAWAKRLTACPMCACSCYQGCEPDDARHEHADDPCPVAADLRRDGEKLVGQVQALFAGMGIDISVPVVGGAEGELRRLDLRDLSVDTLSKFESLLRTHGRLLEACRDPKRFDLWPVLAEVREYEQRVRRHGLPGRPV
jgi:hypothetical protein